MADLDAVRSAISPTVYKRARHVITETARCEQAAIAFARGDYARMGSLMLESHNSLRDDYDVSCPELNTLVNLAMDVDGVLVFIPYFS